MPSEIKNHLFTRIIREQDGFVLGLVMLCFVIVTTIGISFLQISGNEKFHATRYLNLTRSFYEAESGLQIGLWRLNRLHESKAGFSSKTTIVKYNKKTKELRSTGKAGGVETTLRVRVQQDHPFAHIISYKKKLTQHKKATLKHIPGAGPKKMQFPVVPDLSYFRAIADTIFVAEKKAVNLNKMKLKGIIFIDGDVKVTDTSIKGSLIATRSIRLRGKTTIRARKLHPGHKNHPAYYPAIVTSSKKELTISGQEIKGVIYSAGKVTVKSGICSGPIVAQKVKINSKSKVDDQNKNKYYYAAPGFLFPLKKSGEWRIKPGSWEKL